MGGSTGGDPGAFLLQAPPSSPLLPGASKPGRRLGESGPCPQPLTTPHPQVALSAQVLLMVIAGKVRQEAVSNLWSQAGSEVRGTGSPWSFRRIKSVGRMCHGGGGAKETEAPFASVFPRPPIFEDVTTLPGPALGKCPRIACLLLRKAGYSCPSPKEAGPRVRLKTHGDQKPRLCVPAPPHQRVWLLRLPRKV